MSSPNQLSFLPDDYLERKTQRRTNVICAGLFVVVMIAIGTAFSITERSMRQIESEHGTIEQEYTEAAKRIEQVQKMQDKQRTMAHQAELTASLLEKVPRSFLLADITNSMPAGVSLIDFTMDTRVDMVPGKAPEKRNTITAPLPDGSPPPPPPMVRVTSVNMKMTGIAGTDVQVAQFITRLNQSRLLKDVNLVISDEHQQDGEKMRRFQIEATLDPKAEISPNEKATMPTRTVSVELEAR
jgi:Tfp pilus assembly protein PilN